MNRRMLMAAAKRRGGDPYFANVSSLLHFDGANNGTVITDVKGKVWSPVGGGGVTSTAAFKFGTASLALNGADQSHSTPYDASLETGAGDFTIELWFKTASSYTSRYIYGQSNTALTNISHYGFLIGANIRHGVMVGGVTYYVDSTVGGCNDQNWHHMATCRQGAFLSLFVDGVYQARTSALSTSAIDVSNNPFVIGALQGAAGASWPGYIDDFRFTKGVARYPTLSNFTPPAAAFPNS